MPQVIFWAQSPSVQRLTVASPGTSVKKKSPQQDSTIQSGKTWVWGLHLRIPPCHTTGKYTDCLPVLTHKCAICACPFSLCNNQFLNCLAIISAPSPNAPKAVESISGQGQSPVKKAGWWYEISVTFVALQLSPPACLFPLWRVHKPEAPTVTILPDRLLQNN